MNASSRQTRVVVFVVALSSTLFIGFAIALDIFARDNFARPALSSALVGVVEGAAALFLCLSAPAFARLFDRKR